MTCEQRLKGVFQIDIQHRSVGHSPLGVGRLRQLIALRQDRINHVLIMPHPANSPLHEFVRATEPGGGAFVVR
jgi:hypothetical protein